MQQKQHKLSYTKLIKACHVCTKVTETEKELERCPHCTKSFLPSNYFEKIHFAPNAKLRDLYDVSDDVEESHLIRGLQVKW